MHEQWLRPLHSFFIADMVEGQVGRAAAPEPPWADPHFSRDQWQAPLTLQCRGDAGSRRGGGLVAISSI